eukprot:6204844-Pleurochrysis_carterae.AAC.3
MPTLLRDTHAVRPLLLLPFVRSQFFSTSLGHASLSPPALSSLPLAAASSPSPSFAVPLALPVALPLALPASLSFLQLSVSLVPALLPTPHSDSSLSPALDGKESALAQSLARAQSLALLLLGFSPSLALASSPPPLPPSSFSYLAFSHLPSLF